MTVTGETGKPRPSPVDLVSEKIPLLLRGRRKLSLPATLDRRSIFILPTTFGVVFSLMLIVMLIGALNYGNNAALLLTCLLAAASAASMLTAFRSLDRLRVDSLHATTSHAGEPLPLRLTLAANGRKRPALDIRIAGRSTTAGLNRKDRRALVLQLATERRGWMPLPPIRIESRWPFGLFRAWSVLPLDRQFLVYPKPERQGPPPPASPGQGEQSRRHGDEDQAGLRDWRSGDPRKLIAWKASARRDELLSRELELPRDTDDALLDWNSLQGLGHEARIERLTRWVEECSVRQRGFALVVPGTRIGPASGDDQYHAAMRALAELP